MLLFHHDVLVAVLASGSRGNSTYVGDGRRGVLIDCGVSTKQIRARLDTVGLPDPPINGVLLTHEHSDHVGSSRILDNAVFRHTGKRPTFYLTAGTRQGLHPNVVPTTMERARAGRHFQVEGAAIEPFAVPHDTREPTGYVVQMGEARVGVFTDLGRSTHLVEERLASVDVAVLEFNHDLQMLMDGPYPWALKQRVRGAHGHLSNAQAADLLTAAAARAPRLRHVVLAHLSEENNTPDRAREAAEQALWRAGRSDVRVDVARQDEPLAPIQVQAPAVAKRPARRPRPGPTCPPPQHAAPEAQIGLFEALGG